MAKNIQIPQELFENLCRYFLDETPMDDYESEEVFRHIQHGLQVKRDAMQRREAYSTYKDTSKPPEQRQAARREYLDMTGIPDSYRWEGLEPPQ